MAKTRAELVNEALTRLGALPAGQEASAEDFDYVDDRVEPVLDDLAQREIAVTGPEEIEDAVFMNVAACLAYHCRGYFGVVGQESADLGNAKTLAERDLKMIARKTSQGRPIRQEYF